MTTTTRGKIYLSCNFTAFYTRLYDNNLALIKRRWPEAEIFEPKFRYRDTQDWLNEWDQDRKTFTGCVFFDHEGYIGKGVLKEITDLDRYNTPVLYLASFGEFYPLSALTIEMYMGGIDWNKYAKLKFKG